MLVCDVIRNVGFACVETGILDLGDAVWNGEVAEAGRFIFHQSRMDVSI